MRTRGSQACCGREKAANSKEVLGQHVQLLGGLSMESQRTQEEGRLTTVQERDWTLGYLLETDMRQNGRGNGIMTGRRPRNSNSYESRVPLGSAPGQAALTHAWCSNHQQTSCNFHTNRLGSWTAQPLVNRVKPVYHQSTLPEA